MVAFLSSALGCATTERARRPAASDGQTAEQRLHDAPAERLAGLPVPDPAASPENQDQRFGVESARARREAEARRRDEKRRCVDVVSAEDARKRRPPCPPPAR
jgi:hypothetical protein